MLLLDINQERKQLFGSTILVGYIKVQKKRVKIYLFIFDIIKVAKPGNMVAHNLKSVFNDKSQIMKYSSLRFK